MKNEEIDQKRIILFDGVCNLCNGSVNFILQREKNPIFQFASIQSAAGQDLLKWCGLPADYGEAVILIDTGKICLGSTAALKSDSILSSPGHFCLTWDLLFRRLFGIGYTTKLQDIGINGLEKKMCV